MQERTTGITFIVSARFTTKSSENRAVSMQNDNVSNLRLAISSERFENCIMALRGGDNIDFQVTAPEHLYELYLCNEMISKEMRFILSQFEILLRNNINRAIIPMRGPNWILDLKRSNFWHQNEVNHIEKSEKRIKDSGKTINHDRVLAKLTLGFWQRLFNDPYFEPLIRDELKTIFPRNKQGLVGESYGISKFREKLKYIHELRNKVSHQEFILSRKYKIKGNHESAILLMNMMNEHYYSHFQPADKFIEKYNELAELIKKIKDEHAKAEGRK